MIKFACCPNFEYKSFIFIITIVEVIVFALMLMYGGVERNGEFLQASHIAIKDFGAKWPYLMKYEYQIWRFITPIFLHANLSHLVFNSFCQLIFGVQLEHRFGTENIVYIYFGSGYAGNLLSTLFLDGPSVGASGAIFGLLGCLVGYLCLNWDALDHPGS